MVEVSELYLFIQGLANRNLSSEVAAESPLVAANVRAPNMERFPNFSKVRTVQIQLVQPSAAESEQIGIVFNPIVLTELEKHVHGVIYLLRL